MTVPDRKSSAFSTLKDLNWVKRNRKLLLSSHKATVLMNQLSADCSFLMKMKIMDYSLLIGVHYLSKGSTGDLREGKLVVCEPATDCNDNTRKTSFTATSVKLSNSAYFSSPEYRSDVLDSSLGGGSVFFIPKMVGSGQQKPMGPTGMNFIF